MVCVAGFLLLWVGKALFDLLAYIATEPLKAATVFLVAAVVGTLIVAALESSFGVAMLGVSESVPYQSA